MALFLSTFVNKLDKKGRVSVPAPFRAVLSGQTFQGIVGFRSLVCPAIEAFGMDHIEKIGEQVDPHRLPFDSIPQWGALLCAEAQQLPFDSEGRIGLPELFRCHAKIDDMVALVGRGPIFEIWNPNLLEQYQTNAREQLLRTQTFSINGGPKQ